MTFATFSAAGVNWSISKLFMYEQCPMRFRLKYIDRMPEPPPEPNSPLERGNRIHKHLEDFITGKRDTLDKIEAKNIGPFVPMIDRLVQLYACGMATIEEDWVLGRNWELTTKDARCLVHGKEFQEGCEACENALWLWVKLDWSVTDERQSLVITGDWKSGKSQYKAVDHIQQTQLYAAVSAIKYEWADRHVVEIPYVDEGWIRKAEYTREEALKFIDRFHRRAERIYSDRLFRANPNAVTCKYCPYNKSRGTGACPVAAL